MHLTDLITPDELIAEMNSAVGTPQEVVEAVRNGFTEVMPFFEPLHQLYESLDNDDETLMVMHSSVMAALQAIEVIIKRKFNAASN